MCMGGDVGNGGRRGKWVRKEYRKMRAPLQFFRRVFGVLRREMERIKGRKGME